MSFPAQLLDPTKMNIRGWEFSCAKKHILGTNDLERFSNDLQLKMLPEMVFGHNSLVFRHKGGLEINFNAFDALKMRNSSSTIKVKMAGKWAKKKQTIKNLKDFSSDVDWTFTTRYKGSVSGVKEMKSSKADRISSTATSSSNTSGNKGNKTVLLQSSTTSTNSATKPASKNEASSVNKNETMEIQRISDGKTLLPSKTNTNSTKNIVDDVGEPTKEGIDVPLLMNGEKIQWFTALPLFEDELADNGLSTLNVMARVMKSCFLIRMRFYLRVDDVLLRVYDTRFFHDFSKNYLLRDYEVREDTWENAKKMKVDPFKTSPDHIARILPVRNKTIRKIYL